MLDTIIAEQTAEPIELPRLTVSDTFIHYGRMATTFDRAKECLKALPECSSNQASIEQLKELIRNCEHTIKAATRLLEGNR
jgi:hypothetical protein